MRKALLLGGVVLLFAALTACSDGLSAGADDPLADRDYTVQGTVYLIDVPNPPIPHTATVGLRHMYTSPFTDYIEETTAGQNGYYEFSLDDLDYGWYACDAWYNAFRGSSTQFHWLGEEGFLRNIYMTD